VADGLLSIGELAASTGVAVTALRYYDQLGLVRPDRRVSGQRRYDRSAVRAVGVVLFLREVGFSLAEIGELIGDGPRTRRWSDLLQRKLDELAEQERRLAVARTALEHARACPARDPTRCDRFATIVDARLEGASLEQSHAALH
jgi:DNA-binding transcriptional MerR regulator